MNSSNQLGHSIVRKALQALVYELRAHDQASTADYIERYEFDSIGHTAAGLGANCYALHDMTVSKPLGDQANRTAVNYALLQLEHDLQWIRKFGRLREICERIMTHVDSLWDNRPLVSVTSAITTNYGRMLETLGVMMGDDKIHDRLTYEIFTTLEAFAKPKQPVTPVDQHPWHEPQQGN